MNVIKKIKLLNKTKNIRNNKMTYMKGAVILEKALRRISHEDIIISLSRKYRLVFINHFLSIIYSIRNKIERAHLTKYLYHWRYISIYDKNKKEEINSKLKLIILKNENNKIKILAKYFNIWKFKKQDIQLHENFCILFENYNYNAIIDNKKDLINNLCIAYINIQGEKFSRIKLRQLFVNFFWYKLLYLLKNLVINIKVKKLVEITNKIKNNEINIFIIKIIRKWRFMCYISKITKKKLELMYNNLHVSYLDIANEVFNAQNNITFKELKSFCELNSINKNQFKTNSFFIKELGFNSEASLNKFFDKI